MAKKIKDDLTQLGVEELLENIDSTRLQLQQLRFNHTISQLENPNVIKETRREVARMKTELRRRELNKED